MVASLIGGGLAGAMFFLVAYPFDYVKTLVQTDDLKSPRYKSIIDCFIKNMKEGGIGTFYKGLLIAVNRGFFVNAGGFVAFELSMRSLGRDESS